MGCGLFSIIVLRFNFFKHYLFRVIAIYVPVAFFSVGGHQRLPPLTLLFDFCSALPSFGPLSICVILWGRLRRGLSSSAPGDVNPRSGVLFWSGCGEAEASDGNGWDLSSWSGRVVIRRVTHRCGVE
ncbi:BnaC03g48100D [Brassica napus]|uniref:BnaC03g48100D protein n=1 Tax=Brassica napus TaxID=3708 RepID=A0A078F3Z9_BRANA|nr:BnaC03g48100D [Brassica napus]